MMRMPQTNFTAGLMKYTDIKPIFAGMSQCQGGHSYGPAVRNYCLIHYCVRGNGFFKNESESHTINPGQAFVIKPGEITFYKADEENPWLYCWIAFSGSVSEKIKQLPSVIDIEDGSVFKKITSFVAEGEQRPEKYLVCLVELFEMILERQPEKNAAYARMAKDYIKLHYMEDISVEHIADVFNVDRRYLLRLFKKEYGITIVNHIIKTRLAAAYEFLRSGITVNKTAVMCGYGDAYNFSKMFKKYYGISPSEVISSGQGADSAAEQALKAYENIFCG